MAEDAVEAYLPGLSFHTYTGFDGTLVVHVDTPGVEEDEKGPKLRLYLNDEAVFENPEFPRSEEGKRLWTREKKTSSEQH